MKQCLVIGAVMLDIILNVDDALKPGGDVYINSTSKSIGGCGLNICSILNHFEANYTFFAPIGNGTYASKIIPLLNEKNISSVIKSNDFDNGYSLCIADKIGERTFITNSGIENNFQKKWFDKININDYDSVYISGYEIENNEIIVEFLEKCNLKIYYSPGPRILNINQEYHERILALNPTLHLNRDEAFAFEKTNNIAIALDRLTKKTFGDIIITLGSEGVICKSHDFLGIIECEKCKVVDSIGAGDSHIGTFIACKQLDYSFEKSIKIANKISSQVVRTNGSTLTTEQFKTLEV